MSTSLLLALLEPHEGYEENRSAEYFRWIGAHWDGSRYVGGSPERRELVMRELYDVLQSHVNVTMPASGALGTVLARVLTHDTQSPDRLVEAAARLRASLRRELFRRFDILIARHRDLTTSFGYPASSPVPSVQNELHRLQEENRRLRGILGEPYTN
jgi:hypothetical protein